MLNIKNIFATIFFAAAFFIAAPALADDFVSFDQRINIESTSVLDVKETVTVNFLEQRHGIYRDIPTKYKTAAGNPFNLRVKVKSVSDSYGHLINYDVSPNGENLRVKIGDANRLVTGLQIYVINYSVSRALLYLSDQDQLYWNTIAEPWSNLGLPSRTTAEVVLPGGTVSKTACYTTIGSSVEGGCVKTINGELASFSTNGTPLTIVVGWPKGIVTKPSPFSGIKDWLTDNWIIGWPIIAFILLFLLWYKKGRDPKINGALVVQYDPPEGANPAEVGVLFDQKANAQEITATIVHLAVKGYLNIIESEEQGIIGSSRSYSFELKKPFLSDNTLIGYEKNILSGIFGDGGTVRAVVGVKELESEFYKVSEYAKKDMDAETVRRGWFAKSPAAVRGLYMGIGFGYLVLVFWLGHLKGSVSTISFILPGIFALFFGYFMPARSVSGTKAFAHALGFKEYLSKAETARLKWEEKENIFQSFLPYAMIFGVVDKWAKAFEGMDMKPPTWFHGSSMNSFTPIMFAHALTDATSTIGKSLTVAPSAKGGGGFGGGGFGGGGFGGGGGGSW